MAELGIVIALVLVAAAGYSIGYKAGDPLGMFPWQK